MTKVKCVAEHCNFWLPGDFCVAGRIDVTKSKFYTGRA
ncbi:DUF1540 domain-containing protein [Aneurinibacillus tyrosinisolvens]|nr:DUF1540 domain-containing protein [Aneurinibacillus tyrosinisolvens]